MLWTIVLALVVLRLLGFIALHVSSFLIHLLLLALNVLVYNLVAGRRIRHGALSCLSHPSSSAPELTSSLQAPQSTATLRASPPASPPSAPPSANPETMLIISAYILSRGYTSWTTSQTKRVS